MKFTIQKNGISGYNFYIFEELNEHEVNLAQPVKFVMKRTEVLGVKIKPTFSTSDKFIDDGIEESLKKIMKEFKIGDDEHELKGLIKGKDEHIKYLEGLVDKLLEKKG